MTMPTILIADQDYRSMGLLRQTLACEGYRVLTAANGQQTLALAQECRPSLVVIDTILPILDGIEIVRRLREADGMRILLLTARDTIADRVEGLDSGADDYLVKPFAPAELLARVRSLLRRMPSEGGKPLCYADLVLDPLTREIQRGDRTVHLSPKEFDLLSLLLRHPRQVLPRGRIVEEVWGYDFEGDDNALDVTIRRLRIKMEAGGEPRLIHTIYAIGYVLRQAFPET